ncbi:MAG: 2-oxoglutarate oxidoreductase, partial [Gemmatimonadetes bacterium]|nr:2-oxoglutarate oxidoreductase [Gemmatimonadota bacterium]
VVFVSGIGCSSRFPHYVKTYGFHGLHGRALPVASGIKLNRPDLDVFAVMGDGDCTSIGAGHWIHATRYNMDMVALLLDNAVYGLTKMQTSPTTPTGFKTNTQPHGSFLPPLNPLQATLGVTNASFVAQTVEWAPAHLFATLQAAYRHKGFSFVRVLQRCPQYTNVLFEDYITNPAQIEMLVHDDGINVPELESVYENRTWHDPKDLDMARRIAQDMSKVRIGVFYKDESHPRYEETRHLPAHTVEDKMKILEQELDKHAV